MTFTLKINLDTEAMNDGPALAKALRQIANVLEPRMTNGLPGCLSGVWDVNGNKVGNWKINSK